MRIKIFGGLAVAAALAVGAAPAAAVVAETGAGRVGYLPLNGAEAPARGTAPHKATIPSGEPPLLYFGGPVMHSHAAYAIFWAPGGYSFPSGYKEAIVEYMKNVAADSGRPSNVYSVSAQYTDETGHAAYSDTFGGSVNDADAYPTTGTCSPYTGAESFTACITDAKMAAEVNKVVNAQGWPHGLGAQYDVILPPHAGSCFDAVFGECFDTVFCAYHNFDSSTETIYANISYSPADPFGCGVGEYPNGFGTKGNVDDTLSSLSHEDNESITDPTLEAYFDEFGFENGDECRLTPFAEDYGLPLGGSEEEGTLFNEEIGSGHYYLQQEWSNDAEDCVQRVDPAIPRISGPSQVVVNQSVPLSGSSSTPGAGGIVSYSWDFGDGTTAKGPNVSHAFGSAGTFAVTLTVEDDGGFTYSAGRQMTVATPASPASPSAAPASAPASAPVTSPPKRKLRCRRGFRKKRLKGKVRCVRVRHHPRHHH